MKETPAKVINLLLQGILFCFKILLQGLVYLLPDFLNTYIRDVDGSH